jgi:hypothetical protein
MREAKVGYSMKLKIEFFKNTWVLFTSIVISCVLIVPAFAADPVSPAVQNNLIFNVTNGGSVAQNQSSTAGGKSITIEGTFTAPIASITLDGSVILPSSSWQQTVSKVTFVTLPHAEGLGNYEIKISKGLVTAGTLENITNGTLNVYINYIAPLSLPAWLKNQTYPIGYRFAYGYFVNVFKKQILKEIDIWDQIGSYQCGITIKSDFRKTGILDLHNIQQYLKVTNEFSFNSESDAASWPLLAMWWQNTFEKNTKRFGVDDFTKVTKWVIYLRPGKDSYQSFTDPGPAYKKYEVKRPATTFKLSSGMWQVGVEAWNGSTKICEAYKGKDYFITNH